MGKRKSKNFAVAQRVRNLRQEKKQGDHQGQGQGRTKNKESVTHHTPDVGSNPFMNHVRDLG